MPQETGFSLRHENKGPGLSQSTIKRKARVLEKCPPLEISFLIFFRIADISFSTKKWIILNCSFLSNNAILLKADKGVIFVYTNMNSSNLSIIPQKIINKIFSIRCRSYLTKSAVEKEMKYIKPFMRGLYLYIQIF